MDLYVDRHHVFVGFPDVHIFYDGTDADALGGGWKSKYSRKRLLIINAVNQRKLVYSELLVKLISCFMLTVLISMQSVFKSAVDMLLSLSAYIQI